MPSFGSIHHPFAPLGAGEGPPTPQRTNFPANLAYFGDDVTQYETPIFCNFEVS